MSKRGNKPKFGLERAQRKALYKSLATALVDHGRITTTQVRAKALSTYTDKLVTRAKKQDLASRRLLAQTFSPGTVKKLMGEVAPKFTDRKGGYTRVIRLERRRSDGSQMAVVEFVS
ncbi:MAG: 50S ribosomal protein L17 [Candidatus Yanofskybacteria bacterium]|nr:50S ribosomal protein L17 [Candidatus Yanofskybacteria bacterium]